jgi:LmbE family N-acetylglucosaminyl deacetylase
MKKSIVAIMAHADDIDIGAGATFAKYCAQGYRALYGVMSRCNSGWTVTREKGGHYISSLEIIPKRRQEANAAAKHYGAEFYHGDLLENCYTTREGIRITPSFTGPAGIAKDQIDNDDLPQGKLFAVAAGAGAGNTGTETPIKELTELLVAWEPELVLGQWVGNLNPDHFHAAQILAIAWQNASRQVNIGPYWLPVSFDKKEDKFSFPMFTPTHYIDVTGYEEQAIQGVGCHKSQGGEFNYTERMKDNWRYWGGKFGCQHAEAFIEIYRSIP